MQSGSLNILLDANPMTVTSRATGGWWSGAFKFMVKAIKLWLTNATRVQEDKFDLPTITAEKLTTKSQSISSYKEIRYYKEPFRGWISVTKKREMLPNMEIYWNGTMGTAEEEQRNIFTSTVLEEGAEQASKICPVPAAVKYITDENPGRRKQLESPLSCGTWVDRFRRVANLRPGIIPSNQVHAYTHFQQIIMLSNGRLFHRNHLTRVGRGRFPIVTTNPRPVKTSR